MVQALLCQSSSQIASSFFGTSSSSPGEMVASESESAGQLHMFDGMVSRVVACSARVFDVAQWSVVHSSCSLLCVLQVFLAVLVRHGTGVCSWQRSVHGFQFDCFGDSGGVLKALSSSSGKCSCTRLLLKAFQL